MELTEQYTTYYATASDTERKVFKNWLKGLITSQAVTITFKKTDGTSRKMRCTLEPDYLAESIASNISSSSNQSSLEPKRPRKVSEETLSVFDIEKQQWRSFRYDSVTNINFTLGETASKSLAA